MADKALEVVVSPFLGVVFANLNSLIQKEFGVIWGVHEELQKISSTLSTIKAVIEDAEEKQHTDKEITNWLLKLEDAAYDADDMLDECAFAGLQSTSEMRNKSYTKKAFDAAKQIKFRHKIGKKIKELRERFNDIAEERSKFHLKLGSVQRKVEFGQDWKTGSMSSEPQVYGRDEDREKLVMVLLGNANRKEDVSICAIQGIGGLGKTTLAQIAYNDQRVKEHFTNRAWVCVGVDFDVRRLIRELIVSLSKATCDLKELDPLQGRLQDELSGKRFLLVVDDVWNDNQAEWNKLMSALRCGAKGSSIILTTRLETVAFVTGALYTCHLKGLSEDHCWSLFRQYAFGLGNAERLELVKIGKEIVKKCGGVPLAAKALGGLLRTTGEVKKWLPVRDSEVWDLPQSGANNILPALRLSYNHLPSEWRRCFAYCSVYPKGYEFIKDELIYLWMANGLLQSEGMEMEDVGNEIFSALVGRFFFQDIKKDEYDSIETCKMHDLVHDLASYVGKDECSTMKVGNIIRRTRHLSLHSSAPPSPSMLGSIAKSSPHLHSLINLDVPLSGDLNLSICSSFVFLRALDLREAQVKELPISIGKMKHLRYLNLSYSCIKSLPKSICRLRNVQTLILKRCSALTSLPRDLRKMCSLRYLDIRGCLRLTSMPTGIGELTLLRTLSMFIVGLENGPGIKELKQLNIGGELSIKGLQNVKTSMEAKEANLIGKKNLHSLWLSWRDTLFQDSSFEVIEGLQPNSNIRELFIGGYEGVTFPSWLAGSSCPNLAKLWFKRCRRCEHLPPLWKLPRLKALKIFEMDSVKFIDDEVCDENSVKVFSSLDALELFSMPNLVGWSWSHSVEGALFPCLKMLTLERCPKLKGVSLPPSLEMVKVKNCNEMVLGSLRNLPRLSSLEIYEFEEVTCFPKGTLGNLTALKVLCIIRCHNLKFLPTELESLDTLTSLSIHECEKLVSLPDGLRILYSLKSLEIRYCYGLKCLPKLEMSSLDQLCIANCRELEFPPEYFQHVPVLRMLTLKGLPKLTNLPEGISTLMSLVTLDIETCDGLKCLPVLEMSSLDDLRIHNCYEMRFTTQDFEHLRNLQTLRLSRLPKLMCFPEGIKYAARLRRLEIRNSCPKLMDLPDWIGNLTALQFLRIDGCKNRKVLPEGLQHLSDLQQLEIIGCHPDLERQFKEKEQVWSTISNVPHVRIES